MTAKTKKVAKKKTVAKKKVTSTVSFSEAIESVKKGLKISRAGWVRTNVTAQIPDKLSKMTKPYLVVNSGRSKFPFTPSQEDIFADDWSAK